MTTSRDPYDLVATILEQRTDEQLDLLIVRLEPHDDHPLVSILEAAACSLLASRFERERGAIQAALRCEETFDLACFQFGRWIANREGTRRTPTTKRVLPWWVCQ